MTEPDAPIPTEEATTVDEPGAPGRSRSVLAIVGLAVVVAVVCAVVAVTRNARVGELTSDRDDRREVATVAAAFGEAYLSYDFDDVDGSGSAVTALTTARFAKAFEDTRAPGIEELFSNLKTTTTASTQEVFVGEVGAETARALVVVDVDASSTSSGDQRLTNLSFVLDLVREDGTWRVDAVAPAPQPDISGGEGTGGSATTTPTTVTAPTSAP